MTVRVYLNSPKQLAPSVRKLQREVLRAMQNSLRDSARRLRNEARDRTQAAGAVASRDYGRGWLAKRTKTGAMVANPTKHALYMERGRGPGNLPPGVIQDWAELKGIAGRFTPGRKRKKGGRGPGRFRKPKAFDGSLVTRAGNVKAQRLTFDQKRRRPKAKKSAIHPVVWAIWNKIRVRGYAERRILLAAILHERSGIHRRLSAAVSRTIMRASPAKGPKR